MMIKSPTARHLLLAFGLAASLGPVLTSPPAVAQDRGAARSERPRASAGQGDQGAAETARLPAGTSVSQVLELPGRTLRYTARVGSIDLRDGEGKLREDVAYIAYTLDGAAPGTRPVTFAFNGGPGASSAYLNFVAIGPQRVAAGAQGDMPSKSPVLQPNAETWLDDTDLVFIDPPGTGYSRAAGEDAQRQSMSVDGDIQILSRVIARWLDENGRRLSPKYIVGESYGGFRAPKIAARLQTSEGVGVSGLVMISPVIDFALRVDSPSPVAAAGRLVSFVGTARGRKGPVARSDLADVESYAFGDYLTDYVKGLSDRAAVSRMVDRVTALTGLDRSFVARGEGRVSLSWLREVYRDEGRIGSLYDGDVSGIDPNPGALFSRAEDPVLDAITAPLTSAAIAYTRDTLGWKPTGRYELLSREVNRRWKWGEGLNPPEATSDLRSALALDGNLRVLVLHGLSDLVTPYADSKYALDQLPPFGGRTRLSVYPGGHMFYARDASRQAMREDVRWVFGANSKD